MGPHATERGATAGRLSGPVRCPPGWVVQTRVPGRRVWLTFDAGPHPDHTPAVLTRLQAFGVSAGFFVYGRFAVQLPELLAEAVADGHTLGNGAFVGERPASFTDARADVQACRDAIRDAGADDGRRFRADDDRRRLAAWLGGYRLVGWSLDAADRRCRSTDAAFACGAATAAAARPGDILRLHDDHPRISEVLDALLPALADRGLL